MNELEKYGQTFSLRGWPLQKCGKLGHCDLLLLVHTWPVLESAWVVLWVHLIPKLAHTCFIFVVYSSPIAGDLKSSSVTARQLQFFLMYLKLNRFQTTQLGLLQVRYLWEWLIIARHMIDFSSHFVFLLSDPELLIELLLLSYC